MDEVRSTEIISFKKISFELMKQSEIKNEGTEKVPVL